MIIDDYEIADMFRKYPELDAKGIGDPKRGIDAFYAVYAPKIEVVHSGYQVVFRKRNGHSSAP